MKMRNDFEKCSGRYFKTPCYCYWINNILRFKVPDYILKALHREASRSVVNNSLVHQQNSISTPSPTTPDGSLNSLEISRYAGLFYPKTRFADMNQSLSSSPPAAQSPLVPSNSPEPQREALDLANASQREWVEIESLPLIR